MTSKTKRYLLGLLLLVFIVGMVTWGFIQRTTIRKSHALTTARVYRYSSGGRGNAGGTWIDFTINVNAKTYSGTTRFLTSELSGTTIEKYLLHKTVPAVYSPENPSISHLLLRPKDFERWGYQFPDSLLWVEHAASFKE